MNLHDDERALREAVIAALEGVGKDTGEAITALRHRARTNRRLIRVQGFMAGLLAMIVGVLIALASSNHKQANELQNVQQRTSDKVLCPLYGAFLAAANNPVPENIKNDPAQLREREEAFRIIRMGYAELGCKD